MKRALPFLLFMVLAAAGIVAGIAWRNYPAGILLGLGAGLIVMALLRFVADFTKQKAAPPRSEASE